MKIFNKFIILFIFFFSITISAQKTTWLNAALKETQKAKAIYYKVVSKNKESVTFYYKSGKVFRKLKLVNGKEMGAFSEFYETGEIKVQGRYNNGLEEGVWKTYDKKGKIREKGKYDKGEKVGVWKTFYKNF
ncbi:toxin-antitoxin system YwqK family antitoxin [Polaribacter sargassicola]|uniref:toxin-antitoxin system YwqK family antitoxin n=1 Tax=Polaribacter sargassicola TaxID=2836891 RepID=UPI001F1FD3EC|nr:hypothetical protein [Polaribacter sp. DS7-9]MCG1035983.1 hypothetical protein [Polaribacter sp. DS7-9]